MLGKLIKYDLLALSRVLLPVQIIVFACSLLFAGFMTFTLRSLYADAQATYQVTTGLIQTFSLVMSFGILLMGAICLAGLIITLVMIARHFYLNIFSDEGYLTMTLPATTGQHILSKTISGYLWLLINTLVMLLGLLIILLFGTAYDGLVSTEVLNTLGAGLSNIARLAPLYLVLYPLALLVGTLSQLCCVYAALAAGSAWAKRHKVALALLLMFGASVLIGIFSTIILAVVSNLLGLANPGIAVYSLFGATGEIVQAFRYYQVSSFVQILVNLALIVAYVAFLHSTLRNHLNLE